MRDLSLDPKSEEAVGQRLQLTREALDMKIGEFAKGAGIAFNTYSQYESGNRIPILKNAIKLCERYELTLDWIYRGDPSGLKYNLAEQIIRLRRERNSARRK